MASCRKAQATSAQLRPALLVNSVYALIQYLKTFTVVAVMTKGGPNDATNFLSYYAYQLFDQGRYGEATARCRAGTGDDPGRAGYRDRPGYRAPLHRTGRGPICPSLFLGPVLPYG